MMCMEQNCGLYSAMSSGGQLERIIASSKSGTFKYMYLQALADKEDKRTFVSFVNSIMHIPLLLMIEFFTLSSMVINFNLSLRL